jgi:hypothetical protein
MNVAYTDALPEGDITAFREFIRIIRPYMLTSLRDWFE